MKNYYKLAMNCPLFDGIVDDEFGVLMDCVGGRTVCYDRNEVIFMAGDAVASVGVVLSGSVRVTRGDIDGNSTIIAELGAPELFGEALACADISVSPVAVEANEASEILFVDYRRIVGSCGNNCSFHARLIQNMLGVIARKNILLNEKIEILSKRNTRDKVLYYLASRRGAGTGADIVIPFNREELARFLCVDRSALSKELGRMRDEGLIWFEGNRFRVIRR